MEHMQLLSNKLVEMALEYGPNIVFAVVTLIIGLWIIKIIRRGVDSSLTKADIDSSLKPYLGGILDALLKVGLVISVAGIIGLETTSFVAVLGAAGLAVGLALQGSLANFAGGVLILIFKPIRVGDYISAQGYEGVVKEIQVFVTVLTSLDNQTVFLPNGSLANGPIQNITLEKTRRVDLTFGVSYSDDIDKVRAVIKATLDGNNKILREPAADILVCEHAASSVNFAVRPWCKTEDYWDVYFFCHEALKKAFDKENISIPFPQRDIHMFDNKA